jgi:phage shock protein E
MIFLNRLLGESIPTINVQELQEKLKDGKQPFLLDVREPDEFLSGHIAGTKLIPLGELSSRIKEVPQGREIVCICASGNRSASAARKLIAAGFKALSLENGMIAWQMAKLPIQKGMKS